MIKMQRYTHWLLTAVLCITVIYSHKAIEKQTKKIEDLQASIVLMYDTIEIEKTNRELSKLLSDINDELDRYKQ